LENSSLLNELTSLYSTFVSHSFAQILAENCNERPNFFLHFFSAQESDFDLYFASKSSANYVEYNSAVPSLTKFTACVWIKMSHNDEGHYFFTYATGSSAQAIALGYYPGSLKLHFNVHTTSWQ